MAETHHTGIPRLQWSGPYPPCTPSVVITADLNPFCAGDSVTFTPTFTCITGVTISAYAWVINGSIVNTAVDPYVITTLVNNDRVGFLFVTSNGNTYFSNVVTMVEKVIGCDNYPLILTFDNILNIPVADASSISDWNTFFDLPTYGDEFSYVTIDGNVVSLYGGVSITIKEYLFFENIHLLSVANGSKIVETGISSFSYCDNLYSISLLNVTDVSDGCLSQNLDLLELIFPKAINAGSQSFSNCLMANVISFPLLQNAGFGCFSGLQAISIFSFPSLLSCGDLCFNSCFNATEFYLPLCVTLGTTTGDDEVFSSITGQTITLTIPAALMTCNAGNPDGDIQYLQANNTVTIIIV